MVNLILCGGSGTRLWPVSRTLMPKQFVKLFDGQSLFQRTVEVNSAVCGSRVIVSNAEQYFLAKDQLGESLEHTRFLLEPVGRNTAPAIALACMELAPEDVVLVSPSDHMIREGEAYAQVAGRARELAEAGNLVTFGIAPRYPETGYGYIEADGETVLRFVEKPDQATAQKYLDAGNFYWNSGIFCFMAGTFLSELKKYRPKMFEACQVAFDAAPREGALTRVLHEDMLRIPADSIDYAVMEKSDCVKVVPSTEACDIGWSDLGSFESLYHELPHDEAGNTVDPQHISVGSRNCLVMSDRHAIATIDLEDMILVDTADALLVAPRASSQKVKSVVELLKTRNAELLHSPATVIRPWGSYTVLESKPRFKIKTIVVNPGARLSLQKHLHRSEHWVVVSGMATTTIGEMMQQVRPNESVYISAGTPHRLQNEGKLPLVIVEVQVGEYTGEDDIVRMDDDYRRR
jgi:mannose-1-phosphate guanylyltransferase